MSAKKTALSRSRRTDHGEYHSGNYFQIEIFALPPVFVLPPVMRIERGEGRPPGFSQVPSLVLPPVPAPEESEESRYAVRSAR